MNQLSGLEDNEVKLNRDLQSILNRQTQVDAAVYTSVSEILNEVRQNGDEAVRGYALQFDGYDCKHKSAKPSDTFSSAALATDYNWLVTQDEISAAVKNVGIDFMGVLNRAATQITDYHINQVDKPWSMYKDNGVMMGQIIRPLSRVALYVPGGTAAYPSSVLMNGIPAKIAGVKDIAIFTPVKADGQVPDAILAAAAVCEISQIYKVGGAHAIAAAAYGTESIPKADKIVGPGNIYVATAKQLVYGQVDIDMIAGPSEILIIADETANPRYIAADMMSQAEHDTLASAILVTTSESLISATEAELTRQIAGLSRKDIIEESLKNYGAAIHVETLDEAIEISNAIAPEHLEILTQDPISHLPKVQNAGSIFLGQYNPEPLGDYMSGPNHVLPTGGTARFYSPLGVYDFQKRSSYSYYPRTALAGLKDDVIAFALAEGLDAHANAVKVRFDCDGSFNKK